MTRAISIIVLGFVAILVFWLTTLLVILILKGVVPRKALPIDLIEYWYALVGSTMGATIALVTFYVRQRRDRVAAVTNLIERLSFNDDRVTQMIDYFHEEIMPNFE